MNPRPVRHHGRYSVPVPNTIRQGMHGASAARSILSGLLGAFALDLGRREAARAYGVESYEHALAVGSPDLQAWARATKPDRATHRPRRPKMHNDYHITQGDGSLVPDLIDEMTQIYDEVYAEPPYNSGSLWQRDAFLDRTTRQAARSGFAIVLARSVGDGLVGYSFGLPFDEGRWWSGNASEPPSEILSASKFAVIELIVRKPWRGRGIGRQLHDRLLADRPEHYAILTAVTTAPARQIYQRWAGSKSERPSTHPTRRHSTRWYYLCLAPIKAAVDTG